MGVGTRWPVCSRRRVWERRRKPKGTERPRRDNKPSVRSGLQTAGRRWVAAPWLLSAGGWGGKHHSRQTAALSGGLMQVDPATSKGSRKRFFSLICRQCLFLKFCSSVQHSLVTSRWRSVLISLGVGWGDFSLGVGLKGIEENNPISLLLPPQSWGRLQQRTSPPPPEPVKKKLTLSAEL